MKPIIIILLFLIYLPVFAQNSLPRSTPKAQKVSSQKIIDFIHEVEASKHEVHSMMVLRHGKVIAEGWWDPYKPELKHTMYSVSKTFTATAIGFAVAEKKLKVTDKVISFFPESLPDHISQNLANLEIKDLLSMSVGHDKSFNQEVFTTENWVAAFLNMPIANEPGTKFLYNTSASFMLSSIIQKVTGQTLLDFLEPRLLKPLGITGLDWETDLQGTQTGGWGIRVKTEDMAKLGQLFLQKGKWNGKQILAESWIEEASTLKIMQEPNASAEKMASNDWIQGYAYQMWRSRHNSYRADGAFGQYILILPEKDAVIILTSETTDMQGLLDLVWSNLLPAFGTISDQDTKLKERLNMLSFAPMESAENPILEKTVSGKNYSITSKVENVNGFSFGFQDEVCVLNLVQGAYTFKLIFGSGKWIKDETDRIGPNLFTFAMNQQVGLAPFKIAGSYAWLDLNTVELHLRYIESPHSEIIRVKFEGEKAIITFINSFEGEGKKVSFEAKVD
ncbi:beta-lactamase family protein [Aquiflexum sp. TKW24L]|uniref:serine hydrolase domain-containing protein n=1 Tax=Aquiflexum sp. TKW24L TaxID=2942212 RepID=UPI0020BE3E9A|nr:serine hydrolase [Aquiflexum sp. TKW24L]MCL6258107.1 beta-lactamase family protein [Aquiflexum sp. TKW24L]